MSQSSFDFIDIVKNLGSRLRPILLNIDDKIKKSICEICLRINQSIIIYTFDESFFVNENGSLSKNDGKSFIVSQNDMLETLKILCNFSIYSYQNQIKEGFITLKGGHRVGLSGTAIISDGKIINISDISSINLRVSKEIDGCSSKIFEKFGINIGGTLIVGPPSSGKTTILRDISKILSNTFEDNKLIKVSIIDERREIAAIYQGVPQRDVGYSDVLSGFPKAEGIIIALRTMSPKIIVCDEIGNNEDVEFMKKILNCGVDIIASVHAKSAEEISNSFRIRNILCSGAIKHIVLLGKDKKIKSMFDFQL